MNQVKRRPSLTQSIDEVTKKLRVTSDKNIRLIINLEDFSNELFYEIFEYLDGCDIFKAFINLNTRFHHLINSSFFLFKIKLSNEFDSIVQSYCKQIIVPNEHRILSLHLFNTSLIDTFFTQCVIDGMFSRLESLVFCGLSEKQIAPILASLTDLPRLYSLTIVVLDYLESLHAIYRRTFILPVLRYFKLYLYKGTLRGSLYMIPDKLSTIEYLVADHELAFNELVTILSCTPRLSRLTCGELFPSVESIGREISMTLSNLTHIKIYQCHLRFEELELFMKKISSQLRVFCISASSDADYLNANRWERLISEHIPNLYKFYLRHHGRFGNDFEPTIHGQRINQFTSPFWIQRQWSFEVIIDTGETFIHGGSFSVRIQKKNRYRSSTYIENLNYSKRDSPVNLTQYRSMLIQNETNTLDMMLIVNSFRYPHTNHLLDGRIISLLTALQLTHLVVNDRMVSTVALTELIRLFHRVDSFTVWSSSQLTPRCLSDEEEKCFHLISNNNAITKVNLIRMTDPSQVAFLIELCPRIQYLQVDCPTDMDLPLLVQFILMQHPKHLVSLCLCVSSANYEIVDGLQRMIDLEKLLDDYTIEISSNRIHLRWT